MTDDEFNELNEDLPWWVKKKIIDSRRESHAAPPPPPALPRYRCSIAEPQSERFRGIVASESAARRFLDEGQDFVLSRARNLIKHMGRTPST